MAAKLKKSTDITADKIVEDEPLEWGPAPDEDEEEAADRLPGEVTWEREALVSTKSERAPTLSSPGFVHREKMVETLASFHPRCSADQCLSIMQCIVHSSACKYLITGTWWDRKVTVLRSAGVLLRCPAACAGCKIFVLDISEMAQVLGFPTCETERFVTDPEFGTLLPNASYLVPKANLTPPMEQYTNMYPFHVLPHYESLNSGVIITMTSCAQLRAHLLE